MIYTEQDLYEGLELLCFNDAGVDMWKTGEIYTLTRDKFGDLIIAGKGCRGDRNVFDILEYLNTDTGIHLVTIND